MLTTEEKKIRCAYRQEKPGLRTLWTGNKGLDNGDKD